jgi:flagellar hook-length control protein FliK
VRLPPLSGSDVRSDALVDKRGDSTGVAAPTNTADAGVTNQAASSDSSTTNAPGTDDGTPQQASANTDAAASATPTANVAANIVQGLPRPTFGAADAPGTPAESGASSGPAEAKAELAGLPNFGFVAAGAAASSATGAAPASTAAATAVPVAGLAVAIAARAQGGFNQFDIRLDPPELGRIDVRLGVDRDGRVSSHVTVDRLDTLQLLQSQQPQLERALEQAGLKTADNGLQFTLRDQSFTGQNGGGGNAPNYAPTLVVPDKDFAAVPAKPIYNRLGLGTGIDIRV